MKLPLDDEYNKEIARSHFRIEFGAKKYSLHGNIEGQWYMATYEGGPADILERHPRDSQVWNFIRGLMFRRFYYHDDASPHPFYHDFKIGLRGFLLAIEKNLSRKDERIEASSAIRVRLHDIGFKVLRMRWHASNPKHVWSIRKDGMLDTWRQ